MNKEIYTKYKEKFLSGDNTKCYSFFKKNNLKIELGYCEIMQGHLNKAYKIFEGCLDENTRACWAMFMLQIILNRVTVAPKYFEIRNFLEIDLNLLFKYKKLNYIEKIMASAKFLSNYNPETCKYIGRVLWANRFIKEAVMYLLAGKNILYNDPELHYLLAYIYHTELKDNNSAKKSLETCLEILPEYYPAKHLLSVLKN